ncbi:Clavaminate synthase-like protein [Sistotremastrum niveocremeum HHB9708]|uniref:Clavaminate synthase-like protein n=1 Tax=Sistotremastrum niveocremeum HHB9708 TaxID=1314777 RepID=A0A164WKB4_9AGAM|nr:Clavaminate synthase-like protein [Sistotremastrum niveocremeum HHB9708]
MKRGRPDHVEESRRRRKLSPRAIAPDGELPPTSLQLEASESKISLSIHVEPQSRPLRASSEESDHSVDVEAYAEEPPFNVEDSGVDGFNNRERASLNFTPKEARRIIQSGSCLALVTRNTPLPVCMPCSRRNGGVEICRFRGVRQLILDDKGKAFEYCFPQSLEVEPEMAYPHKWNIRPAKEHVDRILSVVPQMLLPYLEAEAAHSLRDRIARKPFETGCRATCDTCMTSLFTTTWLCPICGREICGDCHDRLGTVLNEYEDKIRTDRDFARSMTGPDFAKRKARWFREKRSFFAAMCATRRAVVHPPDQFHPITYFEPADLEVAIAEMEAKVRDSLEGASLNLQRPLNLPKLDEEHFHLNPFADPWGIPSHPLPAFSVEELTESTFRSIWTYGVPILVDGLTPFISEMWTPQGLTAKYGEEDCTIMDCDSETTEEIKVAEFFDMFGDFTSEKRQRCLKLKDWPPASDFKTAFPDLFKEFQEFVPIPNYSRRDGVLNIASYFPTNCVAPDIGPKMYNAFASHDGPGSNGSTRLHMDMADAVNVMTYATECPNGLTGVAAWDLFRREDSEKIRWFLRQEFGLDPIEDPIHKQRFYLDSELREKLYQQYGIISFRVYQQPGEAIFIPAGCAHQVCNLADCIKVAVDFVSPENVEHCATLTREFREQNGESLWKEDVLQLRTMMWHAWKACRKLEDELHSANTTRPMDL